MKYPNLLDRFLTYVKVNTRSDETSTTTPSTQSQVDFANNVLIPEMKRVGLENVYSSNLHNLTVSHDGNAVTDTQGLIEIVGDKDNGTLMLCLQIQQFILHFASDERV